MSDLITPPAQAQATLAAPALAGGRAAPGAWGRRAPWGEVILLAGLSMLGSVAMDMYLPALPRMSAELHASPRLAQLTITAFLTGLAGGQLVLGPLSDRLGRRPLVLAGSALFLAATLACALAPDVAVLAGVRVLQAFGACAGMVIARAVVRDRYDDHEVLHVYALLSLVFTLAPVLAPLVGGWVLQVADWRAIFGVQAAFSLAVTLAAFLRLKESRSEATRLRAVSEHPLASYAALLRRPLFLGNFLTGALSGAALFSYIATAPQVVIGQLHVAPAQFGWVFGANAVGMIGVTQLNARLARRVAPARLLQTGLSLALLAAVALAVFAWSGRGGAAGVLGPLFLVIASLGLSQPNATAAAMSVDRERAGASAALMGAGFFGVGSAAGALTTLVPGPASHGMSAVTLGSLLGALLVYRVLVVPRA